MREASTKPSAATVLPAPVACSNQKRLAALGSSGCSASWRRRRRRRPVAPSPAAPRARRRPRRRPPRPGCRRARAATSSSADGAVAVAVAVALRPRRAARSACPTARRPGGRRAPCRRPACGSSSLSSRSRPEQQRRTAPPGDATGTLSPASSSASAASSATRRGVPGASAVAASSPSKTKGSRVNFAARSRSVGSGGVRGLRRPLAWIQPRKGETFGEMTAAAVGCGRPVERSRARDRAGSRCGCAPSDRAARECLLLSRPAGGDVADLPP